MYVGVMGDHWVFEYITKQFSAICTAEGDICDVLAQRFRNAVEKERVDSKFIASNLRRSIFYGIGPRTTRRLPGNVVIQNLFSKRLKEMCDTFVEDATGFNATRDAEITAVKSLLDEVQFWAQFPDQQTAIERLRKELDASIDKFKLQCMQFVERAAVSDDGTTQNVLKGKPVLKVVVGQSNIASVEKQGVSNVKSVVRTVATSVVSSALKVAAGAGTVVRDFSQKVADAAREDAAYRKRQRDSRRSVDLSAVKDNVRDGLARYGAGSRLQLKVKPPPAPANQLGASGNPSNTRGSQSDNSSLTPSLSSVSNSVADFSSHTAGTKVRRLRQVVDANDDSSQGSAITDATPELRHETKSGARTEGVSAPKSILGFLSGIITSDSRSRSDDFGHWMSKVNGASLYLGFGAVESWFTKPVFMSAKDDEKLGDLSVVGRIIFGEDRGVTVTIGGKYDVTFFDCDPEGFRLSPVGIKKTLIAMASLVMILDGMSVYTGSPVTFRYNGNGPSFTIDSKRIGVGKVLSGLFGMTELIGDTVEEEEGSVATAIVAQVVKICSREGDDTEEPELKDGFVQLRNVALRLSFRR
jgi:hypothetical protein